MSKRRLFVHTAILALVIITFLLFVYALISGNWILLLLFISGAVLTFRAVLWIADEVVESDYVERAQ